MAGEEVVGLTFTAAQKSIEVTTELIKILAPLAPKLLKGALNATRAIEEKVSEHSLNATGKVGLKNLLGMANESGSMIQSNGNILSEDAEKFAAKAKNYGVPISIVGDGEKVTLNYLERNTAIIKQIETEVIAERLQERPRKFNQFKINENNISAMKSAFEENGVECQFIEGANNGIYCMYSAMDAEKVALIKQDFKAARNDVAENFSVEPSKSGLGKITDNQTGKSLDLDQFGSSIKKEQIKNMLRSEWGYSATKADLAANKLCDDLKLDSEKFLAQNRQLDALKVLKTNIRYESDSILMRDVTFNAVHFADGEHTHIRIGNGDKAAVLTPSTMTREEMKKICISELQMTDKQADEAVSKAEKIDAQINSKLHETTIFRDNNVQQTVEIDRTSRNSFSVRTGIITHDYNFNDENLAEKIGKDFGITEAKAKTFINKAQKQSAFINNIDRAAKSAKKKTADLSKNLKENLGKHKGVR